MHEKLRQYCSAKFNTREIQDFFNENVRCKRDSWQIEKNQLKNLHYLNKMIIKCKIRKLIFSEISCF